MKKNFFKKITLLISSLILGSSALHAAPGDTTWVTTFENLDINHYGNFDISASFPTDKTYRKIRMHYILGRKSCPASEQYCGSWDYTTSIIAMPAGKDSVELGRVITPYATDWPVSRKHDYVIDVTDYSSILKGGLDLRYIYEGYSWGFTLTLKFELIEGTPARPALSVKNIYDDYFLYGSTSEPIETRLTAKSLTLDPAAQSGAIKNIISGHGMDNTGCAEFCSKYYQQKVNGNMLEQKQIWKNDCGLNNVYPQTGTWLFDRANWCPGEAVYPIFHTLPTSINGGTAFTADIDLEPYTSPNQQNVGGYNIASQLISYGAISHTLDASIEDIIAPSNDPNYKRSNSVCMQPVIKVKNNGSTAITSMKIQYKLRGGAVTETYNWTGNLAFNQEEVVEMNRNFDVFKGNESAVFEVRIVEINGTSNDQEPLNNYYTSNFTHVPTYPNNFKIEFKTNNAKSTANSAVNETSWKIIDDQGNIVKSRTNCANNTKYLDTISLPVGCYTFIMTDEGCDGISWWYYPNYPVNPGTGTLKFVRPTSTGALKTINGDFGCEYRESFTIDYILEKEEIEDKSLNFNIYPNPAQESITIDFNKIYSNINFDIVDASGKTIRSVDLKNHHSESLNIDIDGFQNGIYFIQWKMNMNDYHASPSKFIVNR